MRGDGIFTILDALGDTAASSATLLEVFLSSRYGASAGRMGREFERKQREHRSIALQRARELKEHQLFYNLVRYLKQDDLIREEVRNRKKFLAITQKGLEKFKSLVTRKKNALPPAVYLHEEKSSALTIVMFDVPEKERRKRAWLRAALRNIGCAPVQKSVWMGKIKIPKEFLEDLKRLHLVECVEMFEITKAGSLRHLL